MNHSLESLLRGQHLYTGLRIGVGLLALAIGVYWIGGLTIAAIAASGAICTSVADMASPLRHKPRELFAAWLVSSLVYLLIACIRTMPEALGPVILLLSFIIAMTGVYGPKAGPIGFAGTFAMVMALGAPPDFDGSVLEYSLHFCMGGGLYVLYGLAAARLLGYRTKQQFFAECCFELSRYLRVKAGFYEKGAPLNDLYLRMVQQQASVVLKQQATRDFLFRDTASTRDTRLARLFIMQVDFFEYILASNTDYELLQQHYAGSDIMLFLRDLTYKCAKGIDSIAYTALRNAPLPHNVSFKAELFAIEHDLDRLSYDRTQDLDALTMLIDTFDKVILSTEAVEEMERVQASPLEQRDPTVTVRLSLFTTSNSFRPGLIWDNLSLDSPYFRYALRATIAMGLGFCAAMLLGLLMPGVSTYGFWILMTISVVLRSNFSMTVQRRTDRIIGTTAGCALTALLLYTSPPLALLVAVIFVAQVAINTFLTINYRYTAAAASIVALIQIHLLHPQASFAFGERVLDTLVGATLAYVCSFIFPSWEYRSLPQLIRSLVRANARYADAVLHGLNVADEEYRLARKGILDSLAELSGSFDRMRNEPFTQQRNVGEVGRFVTLNALFASRMASIRVLVKRLAERPVEDVVLPQLQEAEEKLHRLFAMTRNQGRSGGEIEVAGPAEESPRDGANTTAGPISLVQVKTRADAAGKGTGVPEELGDGQSSPVKEDLSTKLHAPSGAAMLKMDYSDQHVVLLLQKQLDAALTLAAEIRSFNLNDSAGGKEKAVLAAGGGTGFSD